MQIDASKRISALAAAKVSLDVKKNRCAKELCVALQSSRKCKKTMLRNYVHVFDFLCRGI
jgi:hypothetical protein